MNIYNSTFEAANIVKNNDKEKYVHSGYGITFDSVGPSSYDQDTARNDINFAVDNSLSSYSNNCKNNFLVLGEGSKQIL